MIGKSFSEIAGKDVIKKVEEVIKNKRQDDDYLMIVSPTGKGKSYFVKNGLYDYCKNNHYKILYLLPRISVVDEFKIELEEENKNDIIHVITYQTLEKDETHDYNNYFDKYKFVICDECHYFVSDSIFNPNTDRSYSRIIRYAQHAVKLYITATPMPIEDITRLFFEKDLGKRLWTYTLKDDTPINERYMKVKFLQADNEEQKKQNVQKILDEVDETEENIFSHIPNGEKAIVFCDTVKYAHDLWKKHKKDSLFICSRSNEKNKKFLKDIDETAYKKMLSEHRFDCKYVFCTSALDVGFSINDRQLKHIICLLWDWNVIVQAIGRKRILDKDDKFTVYLRDYSNCSIGGLITDNKKKFEHHDYFKEHGAQAYYNKYTKIPDPAKIIYYGRNKDKEFEPAIDRFVWCYYTHKIFILDEINAINSRKYKYQNWILRQFGLPEKKDRSPFGIERDLKPLADEKKIFVGNEGKKELAKIIGLFDDRGRLLTTPVKINPELEKLGVNYRIVKGKRDKETKKQTYYVENIKEQDE